MKEYLQHFIALFVAVLYCSVSAFAATWNGTTASSFAGGIGSSDSPYLIANGEQLAKLAADVKAGTTYKGFYFKLTSDIVLNNNVLNGTDVNTGTFNEWPGIGEYTTDTDINPFSGTFDGDGHTISGIYINNYNQYRGLFRYVNGATIKNLGITDSYLYGSANLGLVVGGALDSRILNCYNAGTIDGSGSYHGGIVGVTMGNTLVANCYNTGRIGGKNNVAGIVGRNGVNALYTCRIENCYNTGTFVATKTNIAGITAENNSGCSVLNCYYLSTSSSVGVYTESGSSSNVSSLSASDFTATNLVTNLNAGADTIAGACRWSVATPSPVFDFSKFTADVSSDYDVFTMASNPTPADGEVRADGDDNRIILSWTAAANGKTAKHLVYLTTDSMALSAVDAGAATYQIASVTSPTYTYKGEMYGMQTYYWRVDEQDNSGNITKGLIWSFRPRHLAFPDAEGYGKYAVGGRGGKVVYVTNLNDSGEGSFREALTNDIGPRTIMFAVSGVIKLESRLTCTSKNVTVAAQTAPGRGICIAAAPVGVATDNIFRFLRVRVGSGTTYDGMGMASNQNSITDHCSISWTIDEAFSSRNAKDITLQRTLISEALNIAGHKNYPEGTGHGYAATIGGDVGSFHHNLLAHNEGRNWSMGGGLDANNYYAGRLDIFNNVVYNFNCRVTDGGAHEVNYVGNYYKKGAASVLDYTLSADLEGTGLGTQSYYYHNNILQNADGSFSCDGTDDECGKRYTLSNGQVLDWDVWQSKPFFESRATIHSARNAYKNVLSDVGASMPVLDNHDQRMVNESLNGTYSCTGAKSQLGGIIDANSESLEGDYSYYTSESRAADFDTDLDGLPDWWENVIGTDPKSASGDFSDGVADPDRDGYTNLEDYLNWMAVPHFETAKGENLTFDVADYFVGYSKTTPVYTIAESANGLTVSIKGSVVTVSSEKAGIFYVKVKVLDKEGDEMTRRFGVYFSGSNTSTYVYECASTDLWTNTANWTPSYEPSATDTTIVRTGEVKAASLSQIAPVYVESAGIFRLTADCSVADLIMQGGTLKSYTSNPLFVLTSNVTVESNSTVLVGSIPTSTFSIKGTLTGSADLTKSGVGILSLGADASAFSGKWIVSGGTLVANAAHSLGIGGVDVLSDTLVISVADSTSSLSMVSGSILRLNADLHVASATIGSVTLTDGIYTSADFPDYIKGNASLIVGSGIRTGIVSNIADMVTINPNPVKDIAVIDLGSDNGETAVKAFNTYGQLMFDKTVKSAYKLTVDMSVWPAGIYYFQIVTAHDLIYRKIVKE